MKRYVLKLMQENRAIFTLNLDDAGWEKWDTSDINEIHRLQEERIRLMSWAKIWVEEISQ